MPDPSSTTPAPLFISVADFAGMMSVGDRTVWRWIADDRVRTVKLGRLVRIPASEVDRIAREGIAAPESPTARFNARDRGEVRR